MTRVRRDPVVGALGIDVPRCRRCCRGEEQREKAHQEEPPQRTSEQVPVDVLFQGSRSISLASPDAICSNVDDNRPAARVT